MHQSRKPSLEAESACCMPVWLIVLISLLVAAGLGVMIWFLCSTSTEQKLVKLIKKLQNADLSSQERAKAQTEATKLLAKLTDPKSMKKHAVKIGELAGLLPAAAVPVPGQDESEPSMDAPTVAAAEVPVEPTTSGAKPMTLSQARSIVEISKGKLQTAIRKRVKANLAFKTEKARWNNVKSSKATFQTAASNLRTALLKLDEAKEDHRFAKECSIGARDPEIMMHPDRIKQIDRNRGQFHKVLQQAKRKQERASQEHARARTCYRSLSSASQQAVFNRFQQAEQKLRDADRALTSAKKINTNAEANVERLRSKAD